MRFLLMMAAILEGGFLRNGIAFFGAVWYNGKAGVDNRLAHED